MAEQIDWDTEVSEIVVFGRREFLGWRCRVSGEGGVLFQKGHAFLHFQLSPQAARKALRDQTFDWIDYLWRQARPLLAQEAGAGEISCWATLLI